MKRIGEKLRTLRQRQGLSLRQLGDMLGVSRGYVWEMEQGKKIPNIAMLIKITTVFNISADEFIHDELELEPEED